MHTHPYLTTSLPPPENPKELKLSQTLVTDEGEEKQERTETRTDGRDGGWGLENREMESEGLRSEMEGEGLRMTDGGWGLEIGEMEGEGWDWRWRMRAWEMKADVRWEIGLEIFEVCYLYKA